MSPHLNPLPIGEREKSVQARQATRRRASHLTAVAEDAQQHQEQVDEVQIERQRPKNGVFAQV